MIQFKKVLLVILPDNQPCLIPIEPIVDCPIIKIDEQQSFWVYRRYCGLDALGNLTILVKELTQIDINIILANNGICFVEIDWQGQLIQPKNALGHKKVVIHLSLPEPSTKAA
jgi:hypothetical protein